MSYNLPDSYELFSFKDAEVITDRANWNTSLYCWSVGCYIVNETRSVLNMYVKLLRQEKIEVYSPKKNSGSISKLIAELTYVPVGRVQRILFEMFNAINDKSIQLPDVVIDETTVFKPEDITPDKILTEESSGLLGISWSTLALFGGVGVVLYYYLKDKI